MVKKIKLPIKNIDKARFVGFFHMVNPATTMNADHPAAISSWQFKAVDLGPAAEFTADPAPGCRR
ncbi:MULTISPECIES: hypothetical protein [Aeromonas]|uniref:hypothetical protein n=1 Tax=Aeromonas TaxID=642 RepID=UPI00126A4DCC|nr:MULTISPECIES: hypothetical protein [Aeromonas]MCH7372651.1 hypothetical protein [Aeromonas sp. MR16]